MAHLGLICPELTGHLNPMTALGHELKRRGYQVTLIGRPDAQRKTESAGLAFAAVGAKEFPAGSLAQTTAQLGRLSGFKAIRFTAELLRRAAVTILDQASGPISTAGVDALLVDQVTPAGETVAEIHQLPFISICNALALNPDPALPPAVTRGVTVRAQSGAGGTRSAILFCVWPPGRSFARSTFGAHDMVSPNWRPGFRRVPDWRKSRSSRHFSTTRVSTCRKTSITPALGTQLSSARNWISRGRSWTDGL
jgi:Glycosyltransferase family 28 N-terminal domain